MSGRPTFRAAVLKAALAMPAESVARFTVPRTELVVVSVHVTVPVGVIVPVEPESDTVTTNETVCPNAVVPEDWVKFAELVRVGAIFMISSTTLDLDLAKRALPL